MASASVVSAAAKWRNIAIAPWRRGGISVAAKPAKNSGIGAWAWRAKKNKSWRAGAARQQADEEKNQRVA
jgi:hypothetical protein